MIFRFLFWTFFCGSLSFSTAQLSHLDSIFEAANEHHRNGYHQKALEDYHKILNSGHTSSALHYNIANTHYAMKAIAPSVYHYKKALQLDPSNEDALHNLSFTQKAVLDDIKIVPASFLQDIKNKYIYTYHYDIWAIVALCFLFVAAVSFLLFYIARDELKRRLFFGVFLLCGVFFVGSIVAAVSHYNYSKNYQEAIVFEKELQVKQMPYPSSEVIFILHEGTSVVVLDKIASWYKVRIADGNMGWVAQSGIKKL